MIGAVTAVRSCVGSPLSMGLIHVTFVCFVPAGAVLQPVGYSRELRSLACGVEPLQPRSLSFMSIAIEMTRSF